MVRPLDWAFADSVIVLDLDPFTALGAAPFSFNTDAMTWSHDNWLDQFSCLPGTSDLFVIEKPSGLDVTIDLSASEPIQVHGQTLPAQPTIVFTPPGLVLPEVDIGSLLELFQPQTPFNEHSSTSQSGSLLVPPLSDQSVPPLATEDVSNWFLQLDLEIAAASAPAPPLAPVDEPVLPPEPVVTNFASFESEEEIIQWDDEDVEEEEIPLHQEYGFGLASEPVFDASHRAVFEGPQPSGIGRDLPSDETPLEDILGSPSAALDFSAQPVGDDQDSNFGGLENDGGGVWASDNDDEVQGLSTQSPSDESDEDSDPGTSEVGSFFNANAVLLINPSLRHLLLVPRVWRTCPSTSGP